MADPKIKKSQTKKTTIKDHKPIKQCDFDIQICGETQIIDICRHINQLENKIETEIDNLSSHDGIKKLIDLVSKDYTIARFFNIEQILISDYKLSETDIKKLIDIEDKLSDEGSRVLGSMFDKRILYGSKFVKYCLKNCKIPLGDYLNKFEIQQIATLMSNKLFSKKSSPYMKHSIVRQLGNLTEIPRKYDRFLGIVDDAGLEIGCWDIAAEDNGHDDAYAPKEVIILFKIAEKKWTIVDNELVSDISGECDGYIDFENEDMIHEATEKYAERCDKSNIIIFEKNENENGFVEEFVDNFYDIIKKWILS